MDNVSDVRTSLGDWCGDFGGDAGAAGAPPLPPELPTTPSLVDAERRQGHSSAPAATRPGGRFWVLASDSEAEGDEACSDPGEGLEPSDAEFRRRPRPATLASFISLAEERGGTLRHGRRRAFAPGGKGSRFSGGLAPRFRRLGDAGGSGRREGGARIPPQRGPPRIPPSQVHMAAAASHGGCREERRPPDPDGVETPVLEAADGPAHPLLRLLPEVRPSRPRLVGLPRVAEPIQMSSFPSGLEGGLLERARPIEPGSVRWLGSKWLWMPKGCTDPALGFPASKSESRRRIFRTLRRFPSPTPLSRSYAAAVVMGRDGRDGWEGRDGYRDGRNKRRMDGYEEGASWRQDGGGRGGRYQEEGYQRFPDQGREDWGSPPPWWREREEEKEKERERARKKKAAEASRARGQNQQQGRRGGGAGGQGGKAKAPAQGGGGASGAQQPPKEKGKGKLGSAGAATGGECFRCGREGHFQSECTFDPICVLCSKEGHSSANCPTRGKPLILQTMGHAITGGGFFNIDVEPLQQMSTEGQFAAVIRFDEKPLTAVQLSNELKNLLDDLWDWQVVKLSDSEFSVRFPSRETLLMWTRSGRLFLPLSESNTSIREAFLGPRPSKALPTVWVQLTGLPSDMIEKERLMAGTTMIGRPVDVDELSLKKHLTEPVRIRYQCRYPERIKGSVQLFVNGEPFTIGVQAELGRGAGGSGGSPPPKPPARRDDLEEADSEEEECEPWNRHSRKNKDQHDKDKDSNRPAAEGGGKGVSSLAAALGSFSAPQLSKGSGGGFNQYGSNLEAMQLGQVEDARGPSPLVAGQVTTLEVEAMEVEGALGSDAELVSGDTSTQVTDPVSSWLLDSPSKGVTGSPSLLSAGTVTEVSAVSVDLGDKEDAIMDQGLLADHGKTGDTLRREVTTSLSMAKGKRTKVVVVGVDNGRSGVRKSERVKGPAAGATTLERAQRLAAERNLETPSTSGKSDDFSVLDVLPDMHISSVIKDSCVVFTPGAGSPREALSLLRAEEEARAAFAVKALQIQRQADELAAREAAERAAREAAELAAREVAASSVDTGDVQPVADAAVVSGLPLEPPCGAGSAGTDPVGAGQNQADQREVLPGLVPPATRGRPRRAKSSSLSVRKGSSKRKTAK
ncbi:hypothetical protein QYE76_012560 [Lolium multiflorum]|uniref:CCHC-type domain-containing protein n=1 Tax=Lolium multiflorum TaxID=4521 RepID=A0AAD8U1A1_LOLMU|nr:hypothetical protein QYE76_012560 [Lolium multiflorum]